MRILVMGASGFLGRHVCTQALAAGHEVRSASRGGRGQEVPWSRCDVTDAAQVDALVARVAPDAVINLAYDMHDWATTAEGAAHVAAAVSRHGAHLVQMSTDCVFSGDEPLSEATPPAPRQPYGAAKAAAELACRSLAPGCGIVRTSVLVGVGGAFDAFLRGLAAGEPGVLFTDQWRCHARVEDVAAGVLEVTERRLGGVFHLAGPLTTRADAGRAWAVEIGLDPEALPVAAWTGDGNGLRRPDLRCDGTERVLATRVRGVGAHPVHP